MVPLLSWTCPLLGPLRTSQDSLSLRYGGLRKNTAAIVNVHHLTRADQAERNNVHMYARDIRSED